jgi:hypothetical protein
LSHLSRLPLSQFTRPVALSPASQKSELKASLFLPSPAVDPYCRHWSSRLEKRNCAWRLLHHVNELASSSNTHGSSGPDPRAYMGRLSRRSRVRTLPFICSGAIMRLIGWLAASSSWYTAVVIALLVCRVPFLIPLTIRANLVWLC